MPDVVWPAAAKMGRNTVKQTIHNVLNHLVLTKSTLLIRLDESRSGIIQRNNLVGPIPELCSEVDRSLLTDDIRLPFSLGEKRKL